MKVRSISPPKIFSNIFIALQFLNELLRLDKTKRISAEQALNHPYINPLSEQTPKNFDLTPKSCFSKLSIPGTLVKLDEGLPSTNAMSTAGTLTLEIPQSCLSLNTNEKLDISPLGPTETPKYALSPMNSTTTTDMFSSLFPQEQGFLTPTRPTPPRMNLLSPKIFGNRKRALKASVMNETVKEEESSPMSPVVEVKAKTPMSRQSCRRKSEFLPWIKGLFQSKSSRNLKTGC